ncbi:hypothetical protein R1flu_017218 [Riccia fluitans]|uniref:Jacalin-type lectin domain-containing protein n=1 Tax=Riccia fluitans TaxID=41844 RepID=A0ABD1XDP7_9MARC
MFTLWSLLETVLSPRFLWNMFILWALLETVLSLCERLRRPEHANHKPPPIVSTGVRISEDEIVKVSDSIFLLHEPEDPHTAKIDLFFFHGCQLDGAYDEDSYISTWKSLNPPEEIWPQCWIPKDYPLARIITVSYDGSLSTSDTKGRMDPYLIAENLVQEIIYFRNDADYDQGSDRPMVLVGHGLGGLIIKQLCAFAEERRRNPEEGLRMIKFLHSIRGIFFYSTPHHGIPQSPKVQQLSLQEAQLTRLIDIEKADACRLERSFDQLKRQESNQWTTYALGVTLGVPEGSSRGSYVNYMTVESDQHSACRPADRKCRKYQHLIRLIKEVDSTIQVVSNSTLLSEMAIAPITVTGGSGGSDFSYYGGSDIRLKKIRVWSTTNRIKTIKVWLANNNSKTFGDGYRPGVQYEEFTLKPTERITKLSIGHNNQSELLRVGWIYFETDEGRKFDVGMDGEKRTQNEPVDIGSGICVGVFGGADCDIDRLGFVFLRPISDSNRFSKAKLQTPFILIGGSTGTEFSYCGRSDQRLEMIGVWATRSCIKAIKIGLREDPPKTFGVLSEGEEVRYQEFIFQPAEIITHLSLWDNGEGTRMGWIYFTTNADREFDFGMYSRAKEQRYEVDVGSGICIGVLGGTGPEFEINRLAFIFLIRETAEPLPKKEIPVSKLLSEMVYETVIPLTQTGGDGGSDFCCYGKSENKILEKIKVWATDHCIKGIKVWLTDDPPRTFGDTSDHHRYDEFIFNPTERITDLYLCDNGSGTRMGWIYFETSEKRMFEFGMRGGYKNQKYIVDVDCGMCAGVIGAAGCDLDRLGFVFLRRVSDSRLSQTIFKSPIIMVGGNGGAAFSCYGESGDKKLEKIGVWTCWYGIKAINIKLTDGTSRTIGQPLTDVKDDEYQEFTFNPAELITLLFLWDGITYNDVKSELLGWIYFETNEGRKFDFGMLGEKSRRYEVDVGSGLCTGVVGRFCLLIDALGFVFLK